ncbi:response regulator [bacterium]|nr:response regulator [bacterium]MBU1985496.1 response regulator [bacterium]
MTDKPNNSLAARSSAPLALDNKRLLVVDDEEVVCRVVEGFLGVEGWTVDSVYSIEDAKRILADTAYPVVLCDVHLPGSSADLLRHLKERYPVAQVIMFTGDPTVSTAREAIQLGAYEYVPKPCHREELSLIIHRAYDRFRLLREQERLQAENEGYRQRLEELVEKRTAQLRASELRYRAIFNRAVDAILLVDIASARIADYNMASMRLLDVTKDDLANCTITDFVGDQLASTLVEARPAGYREWRFPRMVFVRKNGSPRTAQVSVGKVEFDHQRLLQIVARDITDQVELAQRSELMETELLNEQRLAAIGLLASGIAHNINTPLMGIYGAAQLIKMKHPEISDIDGVIQQVERVNTIIRNLMWKSRQEQESNPQEINLNELLREELRFLEADLDYKHNVAKTFAFADNVPTILGRYSDFSQSFTNVVRNALDAMYDREKRELFIGTEVRDGDIRITIRDSGCGIAPEDRERVFLPFFTTKALVGRDAERPTGTGLGLSTVQKLLAPYGARYEISSEVGTGTTFCICVPVAASLCSADQVASSSRGM